MPDPGQAVASTLIGADQARREGHITHADPAARTAGGSPAYRDVLIHAKIARRASARVANRCRCTSSRFSKDHADSATALSQHTPVRPTDWTMSSSAISWR